MDYLEAARWLRPYPGCGAYPAMKVLCFPPAGGGGASFAALYELAGDDIACLALELPGHLARIQEPAAVDIRDVVHAVTAAAEAVAATDDLPYVLFGQCFGAILAFEVAAGLADCGARPPAVVVVAGSNPPASTRPPVIDDPVAFLRDMGASAELLAMPALLKITTGILANDVALVRGYRYQGAVIDAPLIALRGQQDASLPPAEFEKWASYTRGTALVRHLPGGHEFLSAHYRGLLDDLRRLTATVR
jgi:surfactin synthase thioesterase subunit